MKKPYIRLLLFLVLMLALVAGLSYLSLDHVSTSKDEQDDKKMAVALVNEDDGATFNQNRLDFGDAFVKSMDKNNNHEWYVVSRGVAESGLKRGTYDMMMVIPNDFSQKALSINSESPEQVVLDYKINASDNEKVQAQAEETASSILNEFNRRIIDVYFASVIGNLQDAQDNIGELVNKEAEHTYTYNNAIHNPLSNYTDRFEAVKDNTATSKDRFSGLEDVLGSFEDSLTDRVDSGQDYQSSIDDAEETTKTASELRMDFMDQLNNYHDGLSGGDVDEQLQNLQDANKYINSQFQTAGDDADDRMESIASDTENLKKRLDVALKTVDEAHDDLEKALDNGVVDDEVEERLSGTIEDAFKENRKLRDLFDEPDENVQNRIQEQIDELPSLSADEITKLSFPDHEELQNVKKVTKKYNEEFEYEPESSNSEWLSKQLEKIKWHVNNGFWVKDEEELPENWINDTEQQFILDPPDDFEVQQLKLKLPNSDHYNNCDHYKECIKESEEADGIKKITLSNVTGEGSFGVKLKLTKNNDNINLLDSPKWYWELKQSDSTEESEEVAMIQTPETPLVANMTTDGEKNSEEDFYKESETDSTGNDEGGSEKEQKNNKNNDKEGEDNEIKKERESDSGQSKESDLAGDKNEKTGDTDQSEPQQTDPKVEVTEEKGDDESSEGTVITETENNVKYKVTSSLINEESKSALLETSKRYEKMIPLYKMYFGLDLTCKDAANDECEFGDDEEKLTDIAKEKERSLYYLFNEKDVNKVLSDYVIRKVKDDVASEIRRPLNQLEQQMDDYRKFIDATDQNAASLVEKVADTREQAHNLNESLDETLNNITEWREKSQDLVDSQVEIQQKNDEEQTAVMSLGSEFQPLLSQSQSLAEQASNNLDSADNVYQTFDRIDDQADSIQQSGTDLVQQAEDLSVNMTDKVVNDQEFADNFSDVMANSRIGDRQNEDLYDFLSSPVDTKNKGLIVKGDTFTPYFLVLIGFIVALFTAYVISTMNQRRMAGDQFETERSLMGSNALITGITACIGVVEGLVIGLLSAYYLGISEGNLVMWTGLMILVMLSMLLVSTYLLRQLKMIGMFILLAVLSMYLFLTKALGSGFAGSDALRAYSPLQYLETMLTRATGGSDYTFILFGVIALIVLAALANLLVLHRTDGNVAKDDEDVAEA